MAAIAPQRRPVVGPAVNGAAAHRHLTPEKMTQVLSRYQDPAEVEPQLVRHLLACCGDCRAVAEEVRRVAAEFGHWNHAVALAETGQAPELWRQLEGRCRLAGTGDPAVEAEVLELEALVRGNRVGLGEVSEEDR